MKSSYRLLCSSTFIVLTLYYIYFSRLQSLYFDALERTISPDVDGSYQLNSLADVTTVVASRTSESSSWLPEKFPDWNHEIYVTDNTHAANTVPRNKGREGMVYLTYIIDHYDTLSPITLFLHANRYQWHNDDPLYDGARSLSRLQLPYVREQGYINLRCVWTLGCPNEILPLEAEEKAAVTPAEGDARAGAFYAETFRYLFPNMEVPEEIGVSCCAQFAVTSERIRERSRSDYVRYRNWLLETDLEDSISGRILEYSWHIMFGQQSVYCPNVQICYCKVFGLCDLDCEANSHCRSQYRLPQYSTLPEGWPWYDWSGEWQNATAM